MIIIIKIIVVIIIITIIIIILITILIAILIIMTKVSQNKTTKLEIKQEIFCLASLS